MDEIERQRLYDELVDLEQNGPQPDEPGAGRLIALFFSLLYDHCETPEEILAAKMVEAYATTAFTAPPTKRYATFAAVKWPWGDARGILRAGGRTYWEARLRLRDKLVESARKLINERSATAPAPREEES